jgi:hypothetical protein
MLSVFPTKSQYDNSQYEQLMRSFLFFYPELALDAAKNTSYQQEKINLKLADLTIISQNGKQLKFTNPLFLLDDCLNSMYLTFTMLGQSSHYYLSTKKFNLHAPKHNFQKRPEAATS